MKSIFPHTMSRRVVLKPATDSDHAGFLQTLMRTGIESVRPAGTPAVSLARRCDAAFLVTLRGTGDSIGFGTLHGLDPAGHIRCGIYLDPRRSRFGVGAEAVHLLVNYAFAAFNVSRVLTQTTEASFSAFGLSTEDSRIQGSLPNHLYFRGQLWDLYNGQIERRAWDRYIDREMDGVLPTSVSWRRPPYRRSRIRRTVG